MTSPSGKDRHGFVAVTEPALAPPQRLPGRSHEKSVLPRGRAFDPVQVAILAAAYVGAAKVGLSMAFVAEQVTVVWPPTGIAPAALLLFGSRAWPGITLGAAIVHEMRTGRRARRPAPHNPGAGAPPRLIRGGGRQGPQVPARYGGSGAGTPVPRGERPDGERLRKKICSLLTSGFIQTILTPTFFKQPEFDAQAGSQRGGQRSRNWLIGSHTLPPITPSGTGPEHGE
jgi:hypothetical protein